MSIVKKGTLLIPTGPVKHLHIIMNDAVYSPEHGDDRALLVNISTVNPNTFFDNACLLAANCHPFIKRESYVYYKEAVISCVPKMYDKIDQGEYNFHTPINDAIYSQVLAGFSQSRFVTPKIMRFIKQHIIT